MQTATYKRIKILVLFCFWTIWGYLAVQKLSVLLNPNPYVLALPGEEHIPFVPGMMIVYVSCYILPALLFLILKENRHLWISVEVLLITSLIHFFFFLVFPVHYGLRPHLPEAGGDVLSLATALLYSLDGTYNSFPSMHVSFAFLGYYCVKKFQPETAVYFLLLAIAIALSTVLVKQHYILDVISGTALAWAVNRLLLEKVALRKPLL